LLHVRVGHVAASGQVDVVELGHLWGPGAEVSVFQRIQAALYFQAAGERSADFLAGFAEFADRQVVVVGNPLALLKFEVVIDVGDDRGSLGDAEDIRAEAKDSGGDILVGAVNQTDDGDYSRHANHHSDKRQDTAQLVRPEATRGNSHGLLEVHCGRLSHGRVLP
jgi:hypothetical protein